MRSSPRLHVHLSFVVIRYTPVLDLASEPVDKIETPCVSEFNAGYLAPYKSKTRERVASPEGGSRRAPEGDRTSFEKLNDSSDRSIGRPVMPSAARQHRGEKVEGNYTVLCQVCGCLSECDVSRNGGLIS